MSNEVCFSRHSGSQHFIGSTRKYFLFYNQKTIFTAHSGIQTKSEVYIPGINKNETESNDIKNLNFAVKSFNKIKKK